jgi:hypothetical protein
MGNCCGTGQYSFFVFTFFQQKKLNFKLSLFTGRQQSQQTCYPAYGYPSAYGYGYPAASAYPGLIFFLLHFRFFTPR